MMEVDGAAEMSDYEATPFYIGHYEQSRKEVVDEDIFHHAEDLGYDFLTVPITNEQYRPRIQDELSASQRESAGKVTNNSSDTTSLLSKISPLAAHETEISPSDISSRLLYVASDWNDLGSPELHVADVAKQVLLQEITYAGFCGATNVMVRGPSGVSKSNHRLLISAFADAVRQAQAASPSLTISILLPMSFDHAAESSNSESSGAGEHSTATLNDKGSSSNSTVDLLASWDLWHSIRTACKYDNRVSLALTIPKRLPPQFVLDRWLSEPLRILNLPAASFVPNQMNIDVLTRAHQIFLSRSLRGKVAPWILLSGVGSLPGLDTTAGMESTSDGKPSAAEISFAQLSPQQTSPHLMYLREHLQRRQPARSILEKYGAGYQDWPQSPLQPLADNLDSVTYEVFEKDPVKYAWYECAVRSALEDFESQKWPRGGGEGQGVVVAVVGAGRGPLMQRVLQASEATGVPVDPWALEKNPSAFVHLQKRNKQEWNNRVHLVQSDMRSWTGPKASNGDSIGINILVSELLGSLADNELSPECLDGVQHLLHSTHGVSIPSSYSAFATPVAAQELWRGIEYRAPMQTGKTADPMLLPYVSWLHTFDFLSVREQVVHTGHTDGENKTTKSVAESQANIKKLWEFQHPIPQRYLQGASAKSNHHNMRTAHYTYNIPHRGACHGMAGYFEAALYDRRATRARFGAQTSTSSTNNEAPSDSHNPHPWPADPSNVVLSTNPLTMPTASPDMISWFPLFFPFKTPFYVPDGGELSFSIWRKTDGRGVWYEWCAEVFNADGGKCGDSGWHSSEGVPCLL